MCFRVTAPLREYTKIEGQNCQLATHYGGKKFKSPSGVAVGPNNHIVIADRENHEIILFDKDLKFIRTCGQGSGGSKLNNPVGVGIGRTAIVVSERYEHVVKKFSLQGDFLSKFGSRGIEDGLFNYPRGLCFNSKGLLYVVDRNNHRVQVFKGNDTFLFKFGSKGHNPGQFIHPRYIAVDSSDQVFVTDCSQNGGIKMFTEDGCFIKTISCNNAFAICIAPDDYMIVCVDNCNALTVYNPSHECIGKFGMCGKEKGQFSEIFGIAINNNGTIFVTEDGNRRLQIIPT